ncbi:unnamed protein product [Cylicostephanus goldi]|uniref:Uncharacterized protein n=1 Tax=Cylicostephanus goldi TaxID=71465 RepID=A0A3P6RA25_CYLGO|nr:unnamed protein product [Cylicostephanus goldi]
MLRGDYQGQTASASSKFRELLINRQGTEAVKKTVKEMPSYIYASSFKLSLDDLQTCNAVELDEIAFVTFPFVAAAALSPPPLAAGSLLGYWLCLRLIADSRHLSTTNIRIAQKIASMTKHIWAFKAAEIFTMKCHNGLASRIQYFRNDGMFNLSDTTLEMRLVGISSFMMGEIQCAILDRYMRLVEVSERKDDSPSKPLMSVENFTRQWSMDGPEPFVKVNNAQDFAHFNLV